MLNTHKKHQIVKLRKDFENSIRELQAIAKDNESVLNLLKYRCEKLSKEGIQIINQQEKIEALKQHFEEFKEKIKQEHSRGE